MTGEGEKKMNQTPTAKTAIRVNAIRPKMHQIILSQDTRPKKRSQRSIRTFHVQASSCRWITRFPVLDGASNGITPTRENQFPTPLETFDNEKMKSKSCAESRK